MYKRENCRSCLYLLFGNIGQLFHQVSLLFVGPGCNGNQLLPTFLAHSSPAYAGIVPPAMAFVGAALRWFCSDHHTHTYTQNTYTHTLIRTPNHMVAQRRDASLRVPTVISRFGLFISTPPDFPGLHTPIILTPYFCTPLQLPGLISRVNTPHTCYTHATLMLHVYCIHISTYTPTLAWFPGVLTHCLTSTPKILSFYATALWLGIAQLYHRCSRHLKGESMPEINVWGSHLTTQLRLLWLALQFCIAQRISRRKCC